VKKKFFPIVVVLLFFMAMAVTACSNGTGQLNIGQANPAPTNTSTLESYTDLFAYCAAVGTIDTPDARYTGPQITNEVINGFKKAAGLENSTEPMAMLEKTTIWRCMDSQVYACNYGANLPCSSKANTDKTPSQAMNDYCAANPDSDTIPMSVTGHSTIYSWRCVKDTPELLDQIEKVDAQGYLEDIWYQIEPNVPASNTPTLPPVSTDIPASTDTPALQVTSTTGVAIQPLTMEVCDGEAQAMEHALNVLTVTQANVPINDVVNNKSGTGCQSTVTGTGVQFESPDAVVKTLGAMLVDEGWTEDPMLAAGGATGIGIGYRKGDQICLVNAIWQPDASANCPNDEPISACAVKPEQQNYTITMLFGEEK
jgi:hypothetical protein